MGKTVPPWSELHNPNSVDCNDPGFQEQFTMMQKKVLDFAYKEYNKALDSGVAKEQARALLPEGLTGTTLYMAGSLRSWIHYCDVDEASACINSIILESMEKFIPHKTVKIKKRSHPWIDDHCMQMLAEKHQAFGTEHYDAARSACSAA